MSDPPSYSQPGVPRWVKVSAIGATILALALVAIVLISGGEHGPRRHLPGGDTPGTYTPPPEHGP